MDSSNFWARRPVAAIAGFFLVNVVGAVWSFLWFWLVTLIAWLTWPKGNITLISFLYIPVALIPLLSVPFLARTAILDLAKDREAARAAFAGLVFFGALLTLWYYWGWRQFR